MLDDGYIICKEGENDDNDPTSAAYIKKKFAGELDQDEEQDPE